MGLSSVWHPCWGRVSECHQGCHLSRTWVAHVPRAQGTLGVAVPQVRHHQHVPMSPVPSLPRVTAAQRPHSHWGGCREQMGWRILFGAQETWIFPPGRAGWGGLLLVPPV